MSSTENEDDVRATGYYWVQFPYNDGQRRWEPGSWDRNARMWALMGSRTLWFSFQLLKIGYPLDPPQEL